jgi:broad specificity phosphatase PhoE
MSNDPFLLQRSQAAEIFLIRHGDAIPGHDEISLDGPHDNLPLSAIGRQQALALAERLKLLHFDAAYCSPLIRCQQTAAPLLAELNVTATLVEGIREVSIRPSGALPTIEGQTETERRAWLSQFIRQGQEKSINIAAQAGHWDVIPGAESSKGFRARVVTTIDSIVEQHIGQRILIVAHGGVINAYAAEVLGLSQEFFFPCVNTSVTVVRANAQERVMYVLNDFSHIKLN